MHTFHPLTLMRTLLLLVCLGLTPAAAAQTGITFTFANATVTTESTNTFYEFDVLVAASAEGTALGAALVLLNYNTLGFGERIATAGTITATKGTLIASNANYGAFIVNDNTVSRVAITLPYNFLALNNGEVLPTTPQQLLHVKLAIADASQTASLSFEATDMAGQQFEDDLATAYAPVTAPDTDDGSLDAQLPIELSSFTAHVEGAAVVLDWTTASESDNAGFEIEQQLAGVEGGEPVWEPLGFVEGAGTTTEARVYRYRVETEALGLQQFRLKQVDFDGTMSYSEAVEVTVELAEHYRLSEAYPNPFNPQTTVLLAVREAQDVAIEVYDTLGRRVETLYRGGVEANRNQSFVWQASSQPSGLYFIRIVGADFVETRQVTLLK